MVLSIFRLPLFLEFQILVHFYDRDFLYITLQSTFMLALFLKFQISVHFHTRTVSLISNFTLALSLKVQKILSIFWLPLSLESQIQPNFMLTLLLKSQILVQFYAHAFT